MKNRLIRALVVGVAAAGLLLGALPAQAASVNWVDPADDAQLEVEPSEAALDILKTEVSSDGKNLVWRSTIKKLAAGNPSLSLGYMFSLDFNLGETEKFTIRLTEDPLNKNVRFRTDNAGTTASFTCDKCKGAINREGSFVTVTAPIDQIAALTKTSFPKAAPFGPGTKLDKLVSSGWRSFAGSYLRADDSPAPEGTEFTI